MRPTSVCMRKVITERNVKFEPPNSRGLKLRDKVYTLGDQHNEQTCLQQMFAMLRCFQNNNYENMRCPDEIRNYKTCFKTAVKQQSARKLQQQSKIPLQGEKNLSHKQITYLLSKYPNI